VRDIALYLKRILVMYESAVLSLILNGLAVAVVITLVVGLLVYVLGSPNDHPLTPPRKRGSRGDSPSCDHGDSGSSGGCE